LLPLFIRSKRRHDDDEEKIGKTILSVALVALVALTGVLGALENAEAAEQIFTAAFDVGASGNAQKFNPLTASAGFSFYNKYFSSLTLYDVGLQKFLVISRKAGLTPKMVRV